MAQDFLSEDKLSYLVIFQIITSFASGENNHVGIGTCSTIDTAGNWQSSWTWFCIWACQFSNTESQHEGSAIDYMRCWSKCARIGSEALLSEKDQRRDLEKSGPYRSWWKIPFENVWSSNYGVAFSHAPTTNHQRRSEAVGNSVCM